MNISLLIRTFGLATLLFATGVASAAPDAEEQRKDIRFASKETLTNLYKVQPSARKVVESAAGYAVFSNFGMKLSLIHI